MFKKSDSHSQLDLFSSPTEYFRASKRKKYLKNDSWHNQFRNHVVMRVDESIFSVLYTEGNGAPNASIRVLVGMMILKEGQGWSDRQLFYECDCHYRNKDGNKVKGYSVNVTETCDQAKEEGAPVLNLITDTEVNVVSTPDNSFLEQALEHTQEIIPDKIEKVYADGAYHSEYNQEYCQESGKEIDLVLTAMQGAESRYELSLDEQDEKT